MIQTLMVKLGKDLFGIQNIYWLCLKREEKQRNKTNQTHKQKKASSFLSGTTLFSLEL